MRNITLDIKDHVNEKTFFSFFFGRRAKSCKHFSLLINVTNSKKRSFLETKVENCSRICDVKTYLTSDIFWNDYSDSRDTYPFYFL